MFKTAKMQKGRTRKDNTSISKLHQVTPATIAYAALQVRAHTVTRREANHPARLDIQSALQNIGPKRITSSTCQHSSRLSSEFFRKMLNGQLRHFDGGMCTFLDLTLKREAGVDMDTWQGKYLEGNILLPSPAMAMKTKHLRLCKSDFLLSTKQRPIVSRSTWPQHQHPLKAERLCLSAFLLSSKWIFYPMSSSSSHTCLH